VDARDGIWLPWLVIWLLVRGACPTKMGLGMRDYIPEREAKPLGADFQIGAKESDWGRIAT
jgi:hypothetical protein